MNHEQRTEAQAKINYVQNQLGRLFGEDTSFGQIDNHEARDLMEQAQRLLDRAYSAI
ncbi:hypothetical protein LCGC14_1023100 [marine sediment metagenome]|uniref:Uncharacterized protein n=1 Tax=marine sediment metagenome TaxID=412755 RepID=A0A0F9N1F8_9ZZZZ